MANVTLSCAGPVATIEIHRPPHNFVDAALIRSIADQLREAEDNGDFRVIVLCSEGTNCCAGGNFSTSRDRFDEAALHREAVRLFSGALPVVAAVQGSAMGGGLGLACVANFHIATPATRFSADFARRGLHHGFALTVTLPRIVGEQRALELLYTGRNVHGETAYALGLCDALAPEDYLRDAAVTYASEIAASAPLAVRAIRSTMRGNLASEVGTTLASEAHLRAQLALTADFREGRASGCRTSRS